MGSFGERLRREREMRKISLEEIAAATKIGTRHLRALESEDFKKLPGGIFNKGFVRAYARFLGINEEQAVSDYLAAAGEPESQPAEIIVDQLVAQHEAEKKVKAHSRELETINRSETGIPWGALAGLVLVVALAAGSWTYYSQYKTRRDAERAQKAEPQQPVTTPAEKSTSEPASASQSQAAQQVQSPAPTTNSAAPASAVNTPTPKASLPASTTAATNTTNTTMAANAAETTAASEMASGEGFVVSIRATKRSWISVTADGKHLMSLELTPEAEKSIRARSKVSLTTGNAGGVEISFNGKPIPPLGGDGEVRRATFTPEGIQR